MPSAISRAACSLRQWCQVPAKKRERPGLELEHRRADRLQEPAVVGDEHDRRVELDERLLEPLQRLDVEMVGGLVQQQHVRARGERAGQRGARQLPAGERVQRAVEVLARRSPARAPSPSRGRATDSRRAPPAAPARARSARAAPHRVCPPPSAPPARPARPRSQLLRAARQHVVAQRHRRARAAGAGRAARSARPWRRSARRGRSTSRPRASAAASSCPRRCARRSSSVRGARA